MQSFPTHAELSDARADTSAGADTRGITALGEQQPIGSQARGNRFTTDIWALEVDLC